MSVTAVFEDLVLPTYPVGEPERNPVFFEKRVYQGSSGKVYPVPFIDKVYDEPVDVTYRAARLENEHVRLVMLPEIGGRIFLGQDKDNADYDFFYRQDVIKPALVGLAGPWISGGVEFNWPQHHRPGTFLPADVHIEEEGNGARTLWMSEHDPLHRLKGMHGIRLRPGSSLVELRARLYNRTPMVRTFLWWANVAAMVHERYQSFFPPDVHYVADHAVRAMSSFPEARNSYYGVPYRDRPGANRLDWYRNIPVPTSYMVCQTDYAFFGGYDHASEGGFVHVANRHVSPGKKQWTWGNHEFGWAWDRELTDANGPYVELMAGVYTDNQPDFTYLHPGETKTFSQFWWPIRGIGPVQQANEQAALRLIVRDDRTVELGVCVSSSFEGELAVTRGGETLGRFAILLGPDGSWQDTSLHFEGEKAAELEVVLRDRAGGQVLSYRPPDPARLTRDRDQATEPPAPAEVATADLLYLTGEHLEQYRHPTRDPEAYWKEALRRDPGDARCRVALGRRALDRGEHATARDHFVEAVQRLTHRHPNPVTGEAHYHLGLALRWMEETDAAYAAFYKATWDHAWRSAAYHQLATLDAMRADWKSALDHVEACLDTNRQHNKARVLKALVLVPLGRPGESGANLRALLKTDPLDHWAHHALATHPLAAETGGEGFPSIDDFLARTRNDAQTILDIAFDYAEAGFLAEAIGLLQLHHDRPVAPVAVPNPMERTASTRYALAWLKHQVGHADVGEALEEARAQPADRFFPSRPEEMRMLEWAMVVPSSAWEGEPAAPHSPRPEAGATVAPSSAWEERPAASQPPRPEAGAIVQPTFFPTYLNPREEIRTRLRNLPHWEQDEATYAVTFRLADSLPLPVVEAYRDDKHELLNRLQKARSRGDKEAASQLAQQLRQNYQKQVDEVLDQGHGACHLTDKRVARIVADSLGHFDNERYDLAAWCIMPNHVHAILKTRPGHKLGGILQGMKAFTAREANRVLGREGAFWQRESYDHIIRDERDFVAQLEYLANNPEKAGMKDWPWIMIKATEEAPHVPCRFPCAGATVAPSSAWEERPAASQPPRPEAGATADPLAAYALGNLLYDKRRHAEAETCWQAAAEVGSVIPQVHRNLGLAAWNIHRDGAKARAAYQRAMELEPADARLVSEFDQLLAKLNEPLQLRLAFLEEHRGLVLERDDASVALATLYNLLDRPQDALDLLLSRRFHPWEGGEGAVLRQYTRARLLLGRRALEEDNAGAALDHFDHAMDTPDALGEKYHLLQAKADVNYWRGMALRALGREEDARRALRACAEESGDFTEMAVTEHSPLSYHRGLALRALGRGEEAAVLFRSLLEFGRSGLGKSAVIDYFATSLPNLLIFDEDLQARRDADHHLLIALAHHGLGDAGKAAEHLDQVLAFNLADANARDLKRELEPRPTRTHARA